jgi:nitrate/nitrite-specific signal transduction histidine kinase
VLKDKMAEFAFNPKRKWGIRDKILVSFLAVSLISVGIISIFALRNMAVVGNTARQNSIALGESAVAESVAALEDSGRRIIQLNATVIARNISIFVNNHPDLTGNALIENENLIKIAVQQVGQTGYTMVYSKTGLILFNVDKNMVRILYTQLGHGVDKLQVVLQNGLNSEAAGYYDMEDSSGNIRSRYVYCVPIEGTDWAVAADTYIDEFSRPAEETESNITSAVLATTRYIEKQMEVAQWTFIVIIICMIVIIATIASFIARTITEPIFELTKGAEVIARGDLDYRIQVKTGDEVEKLTTQFNAMTAALKESYSDLEQKVEERTKLERQRTGQLAAINEIGRKISSIMNLEELLPFVTNLLRQTFSYDNVNVFLFEPESGKLILKEICLSGYDGVIPLEVPLELGEEGIVAWVAQIGEPLLVNDVRKEPKYHFIEELRDTRAELAVPVKIGSKILGVLDIESNEVDAFNEADLSTAQTLADQLAVAIENARLYKETGQIAVMEERNRIAREIHDTLAQGFTGIILQLEAAEQSLEQNNITEVLQHLNKARSLARGSLTEARRSVWNLRPEALEKLSFTDAIRQEVVKFSQTSGTPADVKIIGISHDLPADEQTALLRICQEALTNIRKHAKATQVNVELNFDKSSVILSIRDNGRGFDSTIEPTVTSEVKRHGFGLISMRERAKSVGGEFEAQSEQGKGTLIRISVPVK